MEAGDLTVGGSTENRTILVVDAADWVTGKTGMAAGLTIYAMKNGSAPAVITPALTELDAVNVKGVYKIAFTTTHKDTPGELALHITGAGCVPADLKWQVLPNPPGADVGITQAAADKVWSSSARSLTTFGTLVADIAAAVWGATARVLTAGTNIVLAKGTGITGFNDIAAGAAMTLTTPERESLAAVVEAHLLNEGDSQMLINAIVGAIGNTNMDQTVLIAAIRADIERTGGSLKLVQAKTDQLGLAEIAGAVWNEAMIDHAIVGSMAAALDAADPGGFGAIAWPYTVTGPGPAFLPIADAEVWVTSDAAGFNVIRFGRTDENGLVTFFYTDPGTFYYWVQKVGYTFSNPDMETVP